MTGTRTLLDRTFGPGPEVAADPAGRLVVDPRDPVPAALAPDAGNLFSAEIRIQRYGASSRAQLLE
jgi:hypothetical protein